MPDPLRLLLVEDSEDDAWLIARQLERGGLHSEFHRVETLEGMRQALASQSWDVIISDYALPKFGGPAALALYHRHGLDIPFIVVSAMIGEEAAVEMMKSGAHDYVMKGSLSRLEPALRRELLAAEARRIQKKAEAARAHLAAIVESCDEAIVGKNLDGTIISWNAASERLYGYTAEEMIGRSISVLVPAYRPRDVSEIFERASRGENAEAFETVRIRKDGQPVEVSLVVSPIKDSTGKVIGASTMARDISRIKEDERERLRLIEELTAALGRVKTLGGLLPICSGCKKIRDDHGYWEQVETYVQKHSDAEFSHGLCPDCATRLYPEYYEKTKT